MKLTIRDMVTISLFTALMVVGAKLTIPTPFGVALTFQLFFAVFAGLLLGARNGFLSQLIYLLLGLAGMPVFSTGGGISYVFSPTFGYLIGFMLAATLIGFLKERSKKPTFMNLLIIVLIGYLLDYLVGNLYFYFIKNLYLDSPMELTKIFTMMLPFMIKDLVLVALASYCSTMILPQLKKIGYIQ